MEPLLKHLQQPSNLEGKESETGMPSGSKIDAECSDSDKGNPRASSATNKEASEKKKIPIWFKSPASDKSMEFEMKEGLVEKHTKKDQSYAEVAGGKRGLKLQHREQESEARDAKWCVQKRCQASRGKKEKVTVNPNFPRLEAGTYFTKIPRKTFKDKGLDYQLNLRETSDQSQKERSSDDKLVSVVQETRDSSEARKSEQEQEQELTSSNFSSTFTTRKMGKTIDEPGFELVTKKVRDVDEEVLKAMEIGDKLGLDFVGKEAEMADIIRRRELEDTDQCGQGKGW
ncbi:hypothetical protein QYF36_026991 [Acer negundo]|nr:hypothetical protein QYF36_026991 [Acer negundo]